MLSYQTVEPHTLELLKKLMTEPLLTGMRLVGGTSLALQYGHRNSIDLDFFGTLDEDSLDEILGFYQKKYPEHSVFRALMSLSYFDDAEKQMMPKMFSKTSWDEMKAFIIKEVEKIK